MNIFEIIIRLERRLLRIEKALAITAPKEELSHPKAARQFEAEERRRQESGETT